MVAFQDVATHASFQAFVNCYLREVDSGRWKTRASFCRGADLVWSSEVTDVVELELPLLGQSLILGVSYRSLVGRHTLCEAYQRVGESGAFRRLDPLSVQLLLIDSIYARAPERPERLELLSRVLQSHQGMARYLEHSVAKSGSVDPRSRAASFIDSEQSSAFGHWLHPTPKSRQGIAAWQDGHYSPELRGRFQLHFFAAARHLVEQESIARKPAESLSRDIALQGPDRGRVERLLSSMDDLCLIPVHPLQAHFLVHQPHVRRLLSQGVLTDLGPLGPQFTPTSSVRTVYCESCDYMLKLSIPVKITNSLRINLKSELGDSVWISQLLRRTRIEENFPEVAVMEDPASMTIALPGMEETGFEVIFRRNPFPSPGRSGEVHAVTALVSDPLPGEPSSLLSRLVRASAERLGLGLGGGAKRWFDAYFRCTVESTLRIYDAYGTALEAHQQNSLIAFDAFQLPERFYYRDIQGLALLESFRGDLTRMVPELARQEKVFEPDDIVRNGLGYYLFFNHLYPVIYRFGLDGLHDEKDLLELVRRRLTTLRTELSGPGRILVDGLLHDARIPCKANLLTRAQDLDELQAEQELAVYAMMDNPLASPKSPRVEAGVHDRNP